MSSRRSRSPSDGSPKQPKKPKPLSPTPVPSPEWLAQLENSSSSDELKPISYYSPKKSSSSLVPMQDISPIASSSSLVPPQRMSTDDTNIGLGESSGYSTHQSSSVLRNLRVQGHLQEQHQEEGVSSAFSGSHQSPISPIPAREGSSSGSEISLGSWRTSPRNQEYEDSEEGAESNEGNESEESESPVAAVASAISDETNAHYQANMFQLPGIDDQDKIAALSYGKERYVFIKRIGSGAYATIYKAVKEQDMNTQHRQEVAIKVVKPRIYQQKALNSAEIAVLKKLLDRPHANIIRFMEFFKDNAMNNYYMVFELAPLGDLYSAICQTNDLGQEVWVSLKPQYCRHLIKGIGRGVRHLFSLRISHGDIKLENIVIFGDEPNPNQAQDKSRFMRMVPKLIDFNNSIFKSQRDGSIISHQTRGSLYTAAPESWFSDTPYDCRIADVYSVGAVLLCMLLGVQPWIAPANCPQVRKARESIRMKKDRNFLKLLVRPFDIRLKQVLLRILEPLPQNRITIQEFLSDDWFTQRMESQELEERWESRYWKGQPQNIHGRRKSAEYNI